MEDSQIVEQTSDSVTLYVANDHSTSVKILKYGATVISWKVKGKEQLFLSEGAKTDGSKPVRGGIPLVFPVFGKCEQKPEFAKLPQHGFARNSTWDFLGLVDEHTAQFALSEEDANPEIYSKWGSGDNKFCLFFNVKLDEKTLTTSIEVENCNTEKPFEFNWLFHTYLRTPDIEDTLVSNLTNEVCYDQLLKQHYEEKSPALQFHQEIDRIYKSIPKDRKIQVLYLGKAIHTIVRDENLPDVVVWNPWIEKADTMSDFQPKDAYKQMVCIEAGKVAEFVKLEKHQKWKASQVLAIDEDIHLQSQIF